VTARDQNRGSAAFAGWLGLAAAPSFAGMALATSLLGRGLPDILCVAGQGASPLGGMPFMYLLMSLFHLPPWLRLAAGRRDSLGEPRLPTSPDPIPRQERRS
jgi:hypothetical protein